MFKIIHFSKWLTSKIANMRRLYVVVVNISIVLVRGFVLVFPHTGHAADDTILFFAFGSETEFRIVNLGLVAHPVGFEIATIVIE